MSKKTRTYLILGLFLGIVYLIGALIFIHIKLVLYENPDMDVSTGITEGFQDLLKQPFAIFPMAPGTLLWVILVPVILLFIVYIMVSNANMRKHYNNDTAQGDAKWLTDNKKKKKKKRK